MKTIKTIIIDDERLAREELKSLLLDFIEIIEDQEEESLSIKSQKIPQELMDYYASIKKIERMRGIQMRLPFEVKMD